MADETVADPRTEGVPKSAFAKASDQIRKRTDRFQQVYANNMSISINTWDFAITFGELTGEQDGKTVVEETVKVLMTREMAKVLSTLLNNHIAIFEETFWEIKLPVLEPDPAQSSDEGKPES